MMNQPAEAAAQPVHLTWPARYSQLPKEVFHRQDIYQLELERIFYGPEWHPVAHAAELPNPGDFKTFRIGEVPILILRGDDHQVRVFFNSCTHRGTQLETRVRGHAAEFECPYHRWLFNNRGDLLACPGLERFPAAFDKQDYGLRQLRSGEYMGLIFATMSREVPELDGYLGETKPFLATILGGDGRLHLLGYQKVCFATNWKEYNDNDGYHAPLLHRAFRLLRWQGGSGTFLATNRGHLAAGAELRESANAEFLNDPSIVAFRDRRVEPRSTVLALFPMTVIVKHCDVINVRFAFPVSVDEVEIHYAYFSHADDDPEMLRHRLRQSSNLLGPSGLISLEDGAVFNRLHRGDGTPGTVSFQKGVVSYDQPPGSTFGQNDESGNMAKWEYYIKVMGFARAGLSEASNGTR
jgi:phenylpropionate dioxygenase-like ring-hydroxylating dioxygenase large terminal subunit